jgi:hypothetical protein
MRDLSAAELDRLFAAADPALDITESELAQSRARSLSFQESEVTHIFAGSLEEDRSRIRVKRRRIAGGILAAVAVAATVLTASFLQMPPTAAPAATTPAATDVAADSPTPTADPGATVPSGPMHDVFVAADDVFVMEALPGNAGSSLGVERVVVRQVLKGSHALGETSVDVSSADDGINGSLLWRQSQKEAPMTYLGFFNEGSDGGMRLLKATHALLQIQNIRTATTVDPVTEDPVDIGDDLRSRIDVAPEGDVPVSTYTPDQAKGATTDFLGTEMPDGTREGVVRGHISATEACFTFENSTEKVYMRWPAGFTAALRSLRVNAQGVVSPGGTAQADTPVVLNEWGFIYMTDRQLRPQITGYRSAETATCAGESLQVFDVQPERPGASPFQHGRGVALPTP